jgi:hypothetical protein
MQHALSSSAVGEGARGAAVAQHQAIESVGIDYPDVERAI